MAQFGSEMPLSESGGAVEWAVSFRFPVTWDCLSGSGDKVEARAAQPISPAAFVRSTTKAPEAEPPSTWAPRVPDGPSDAQLAAKAEWGIVVPKMARSGGRAGQTLLSTAAGEAALAAGGAGISSADAPPLQTPSFRTPSFQTVGESSWAGVLRTATFGGKAPLIAAAAVGVALLASVLWMRIKVPAVPAQMSQTQAAPKAQQTSLTDVQAAPAPQAPATQSITTIPAAKSEKTPAKPVTASFNAPVTPTAVRPVTLQQPGGPISTPNAPSAQSVGQTAVARAPVVADPGETVSRAQAPIAARTAEPVEAAAAPAARAPVAVPAPAPSASISVSPAPPVSASPAAEPQSAASLNTPQNTPLNTSPSTPVNASPVPARVIAPALPAPTVAIKTGGQLQQAQLISRKSPAYPVLAQRARVEGSVVLDATVGTDGRLKNIRVLEGHPLLQSAAVDAVKQWVYRPATLNGTITESDTHLVVTFGRAK